MRNSTSELVPLELLLALPSRDLTLSLVMGVQVWSLHDCKCVRTLEGHRNPIRRLEVSIRTHGHSARRA